MSNEAVIELDDIRIIELKPSNTAPYCSCQHSLAQAILGLQRISHIL